MISGASIDRCVRILLTTFYHMHHYTMQLLGRWSRVHCSLIKLDYLSLSSSSSIIYFCLTLEARDGGGDPLRVNIIMMLIIIPYSRKIWRGIRFGGLAVYIATAKLKSAKISYSHIYVWRSRTEPPNLNPPIFLQ